MHMAEILVCFSTPFFAVFFYNSVSVVESCSARFPERRRRKIRYESVFRFFSLVWLVCVAWETASLARMLKWPCRGFARDPSLPSAIGRLRPLVHLALGTSFRSGDAK
jgi:hypothetical protein